MNIALLEPKSRENLATVLRSGQNFGVQAVFVIGGFVRERYKGNIHKFDHQMNTQDGIAQVALLYFATLQTFLQHLPARTTLVVVETYDGARDLTTFAHPPNATYLFGRETRGIQAGERAQLEAYFAALSADVPVAHRATHKPIAHLQFVKIDTPRSLNLGVCASIVMYDRQAKRGRS